MKIKTRFSKGDKVFFYGCWSKNNWKIKESIVREIIVRTYYDYETKKDDISIQYQLGNRWEYEGSVYKSYKEAEKEIKNRQAQL